VTESHRIRVSSLSPERLVRKSDSLLSAEDCRERDREEIMFFDILVYMLLM
jgi:hypothetical protein